MMSSINKRSIVFYRNAYYYFYYLAKALRKRGWDAVTVSVDDPNSKVYQFYHGEDINLFSADPEIFRKNIDDFYTEALERFDMVYFQGDHCLSFYPENYTEVFPADLAEWIGRGKKIGYISSGCLSGISQCSISDWSSLDGDKKLCDKCIYKNNGSVCSDYRNLNWGRRYNALCDIVSGVYLPAIDYMAGANVFYDPIDIAMDSSIWTPDLIIPKEHKISKEVDEILIFHSMANYAKRTRDKINIKGTSFILDAVEKIKSDGIKCKIIFKSEINNFELRYYQAQADIIIEQLNFGRMGATSREGLMIGKPVITYLNRIEPITRSEHKSMLNNPVVSATETTIYKVLKDLCLDKNKRTALGKASREYALRWFDADACAKRFEEVYDIVMSKGRYNNGIYYSSKYAGFLPQKDIYDYYIELSKKGEYKPTKIIDSYSNETYFKQNWGKYLEFAWLHRKIPHYFEKRNETGICKFGEYFEEALIEMELGRDNNALHLLEKAKLYFGDRTEQFLDIHYTNLLFLISQIAFRNNDFEKYLENLLTVIKISDEFTEALTSLAEMYEKTNHLHEAKKLFENAYLSRPSDCLLIDNLKNINVKLGLKENHISMLDEWVQKKISESEELISREELIKAKEILDKIEVILPESLECLNDLAVIEILSGNVENAIEKLNKILKIDPRNEVALENMQYISRLNQ